MIAFRKTVLFFLYLALWLLQAAAQKYPITYLGIEQGLSNNSIVTMCQDHTGKMWFGTYDGLNCYNGYEFQVFRNRIGDSTSLLSNTIYTLAADSKHNIWVGSQKGGCVYNPAKATFTQLVYQPTNGGIAAPLQDNIHQIWQWKPGLMLVATQTQGLLFFENNTLAGKQIPLQNTFNYDVVCLTASTNATHCWVYIRQAGLYLFNATSKQMSLASNTIKQVDCMLQTNRGSLWMGNQEGLFLYDSSTKSVSGNYLPEHVKVSNIMEDRRGTLWISTDGSGIFMLQKGDKQATRYTLNGEQPLLKSDAVSLVYEDKDGRKWIGTLRGGISMLEPVANPFQQIFYAAIDGKQKPSLNFILSFCEDVDNNVWVGTDGAGLRYWNRKLNTFTNFTHAADQKASISSNYITSIIRDSLDDVWISTWFGGLNRYHRATKTFEHFTCYNPTNGRTEENIWQVFQDKQHRIWASATNPGCLYLFNRQRNAFELFDNRIKDLQTITQTNSGDIWAGNYSQLIKIDPVNKQHQFYPINYPVRSILEDEKKNFWVGTQEGGLLLFDRATGRFTRYSMKNGLPSNTILRMLKDKRGNIWMSTYNGLSQFDPANKTFRNFSISDGLQSSQFGYNAGLALSSGEFLFGGINGFNVFYPGSIQEHRQPPKLLLTSIAINNKPVETDSTYVTQRDFELVKGIRLPYNEATLSLDFLSLNYFGTDKISYAYYLEGWDKEWNYTGNGRKANYSRLHEGKYIFKVKATDNYGNWSQPYPLLTVEVLPPWYRTWWAYLLYLLVLAAVFYTYILYNRRQERLRYEVKLAHLESEKEKELAEKQLSMFTNISHEFRTPLSLIIDPLKKAISSKNNAAPISETELTTAHRNARRLLSLVDQLLLFRKADSGADHLNVSAFDGVALCKEVYECFTQQAKQKQIGYRFETSLTALELYGDYEKLEIALFNLLSNAFKFTSAAGSIQLRLSENEGQAIISVSDNGIGINQSDAGRIFEKFQQAATVKATKSGFGIGLYLVRHFVEQHKGLVSCSSAVGQGTTFTIQLLKGKNHFAGQYILPNATGKTELVEELFDQTTSEEEATLPNAQLHSGAKVEEVVTDKKSVLVVEDNNDIRQYIIRLLSPTYLVYEASSGEEGWQLAEKHVPDLVISDITMGDLDGVALCRAIKTSESLSHIPVILLTAITNTESKLQGISGGADDYITKPFDSDLLLARVDSLLKSRSQLRSYFLDSITLKENSQKVPAEYRDFLKKCIDLIEANLDKEDFTIKTFAKAMGMSHSALYTKIKSISGQTLNAFIRSIRIRRAAVLMLTENMNVSQAGFQVGFEDVRYFREQFIKLFGMPPSEYIKKYRHSFNADLNVVRK